MKPSVKTILTALFAMCFATPVISEEQAPEQPAKPAAVCESNKRFGDFDFWLGEWNVYSNDDKRQLQGTNSISKHHENCLIMENWTNLQGGTGSSMNYYDPVEGQWRQLWVAGGYSIDYTGGLDESGSMVLNGKINYYKTGKSHAFRGRWTPNADGSVRQFFEQQDPESQEWSVWFDGLYVKQVSE
jgi:hypothetical protein